MRLIAIFGLIIFLQGCGTAPMVRHVSTASETLPRYVDRLALTGTTSLKDKISFELSLKGFKVVDPKPYGELSNKYNIEKEDLVSSPDVMMLKNEGIDVIITITSEWSEFGKRFIESAYIKVMDTSSGKVICGVEYRNGFNGMPGSPADYNSKESIDNTSVNIVSSLLNCISPITTK